MTIGQLCYSQEYCTNCPARKQCSVLPLFYSEKQYQDWRNSVAKMFIHCTEPLHLPYAIVSAGLQTGLQMMVLMDKRRKRELELHPEYSPE